MAAVMVVLFLRLPTLPREDQDWMMAQVIAPVGATHLRSGRLRRSGPSSGTSWPSRRKVDLHGAGLQFRQRQQNTGIAWNGST